MAAKKPLSVSSGKPKIYADGLASPKSPLDCHRPSPVGLGILAALAGGAGANTTRLVSAPIAILSPRAVKIEVSELGCSWRSTMSVDSAVGAGVGSAPGERIRLAADFLSSCFLCRRRLDGKDIYMYRGEKGFCSAECRCQQIAIDEYQESDKRCPAAEPMAAEVAGSPYSGGRIFFTGIAVA